MEMKFSQGGTTISCQCSCDLWIYFSVFEECIPYFPLTLSILIISVQFKTLENLDCRGGKRGKKLAYSETCLKRAPLEPIFLSALDRCPLQTDYVYETLTSKLIFGKNILSALCRCPLYSVFALDRFYCIFVSGGAKIFCSLLV